MNIKISNEKINQIIRESINNLFDFDESIPSRTFGGGNVDNFTPYSKEERERNFSGLGRMGNPTYDAFKAWREEGLRRGIPSVELGWAAYQKAIGKWTMVDWEQVRVDAAINVMNAILSSSIMIFIFQFVFKKQIADIAVNYADKLVEELKKHG